MEFSEFAFRVILLFLPGIICGSIVDALTVHRRRRPFGIILRALVFGMGAYYLYGGLMLAAHGKWIVPHRMMFFRALQDKQVPLPFNEIAVVCAFACLEGFAFAFVSNRKWSYRLAGRMGLTRESGHLDVWESVLYTNEAVYATVRDQKHDLVYDGWIDEFSDDGEKRELLLRDVRVSRNSDSMLLYGVGAIYLAFKKNEQITLEFPGVALTEEFDRQLQEEASYAREQTQVSTIERGNDQEGGEEPAADQPAASPSASANPIGTSKKEVTRTLAAFCAGVLVAILCCNQAFSRPKRW